MSNKIYVGGGKVVNGNFGLFHRISFNKKDLETMLNNLNSKGYINLNMNERREPSQYGQTHSLVIDTWEPTNNQIPKNDPQQVQNFALNKHETLQQKVVVLPNYEVDIDEDLPF